MTTPQDEGNVWPVQGPAVVVILKGEQPSTGSAAADDYLRASERLAELLDVGDVDSTR